MPLKHADPALGEGYDYDVCNSDVILHRMQVKNGRIVLPDGMSYAVLVLPDWKVITPEVLIKLSQLAKAGATIIGPQPLAAAGLKNRAQDAKVKALAAGMWGKGDVLSGPSIREVLEQKKVTADFSYESRKAGALIDYIHRRTGDADIYYVVNRNERPEYINAIFRVNGKQPELWNPDKGTVLPQTVYAADAKGTKVPLFLDPFGSVFVVFRKNGKGIERIVKNGQELFPALPADTFDVAPFVTGTDVRLTAPDSIALSGAWTVNFSKAWGGPESVVFERLMSWTDHTAAGIKYYSGTAVYHHTFSLNAAQVKNKKIFLDLGELYNVAEVMVNGHATGVWWTHPFRDDVTAYLKEGENKLEIKVVNLWPNRIIGDQYLPEGERFTKTNVKKFTKDYPLRKSGLVGPVRLDIYDRK